jgi:hypothetical protein
VAVDAEEKLFCAIRLSDGNEAEALRTLNLISRKNMEDKLLDVLWSAHFVDRRIKGALREIIDTTDKGLVRLIRQRLPELSPKEIADSFRRLDFRVEYPPPVQVVAPGVRPPGKKARKAKATLQKKGRTDYRVSLADLIGAGLLSPPLRLFRKYKGKVLEATLLADGGVEFGKTRYDTCSTAASNARATITGRQMHTNGWSFWQYQGDGGKKVMLEEARSRYLATRPGQA